MRLIGVAAAIALVLSPSATAQDGAPKPDCKTNGCLRAVQFAGSFARTALQPYVEPGVRLDNGYSVLRIRFYTSGREATATVAVPFDPGLSPPAGGWHIVANNHATSGIEDPCAVGAGPQGAGLAGYFGARGLIGVTVDYPGLGTAGLHAYLDKEQAGAASLDALRATRAVAASLAIRTSGRFAVAGLSQGGHAALSAASMKPVYAPELDIRAYAAAAPSSAWEEHWSLSVQHPGSHVAIQAMLFYSWSKTYGWKNMQLWTSAMARTIDRTMTSLCALAPGGTLMTAMPQDPGQVFHPDFLKEFRERKWSKYKAVHQAFEKNSIRSFVPSAPVRIYQGDADTIVVESATRQMVDALKAAKVEVDYVVVPGGDHTNVAFHFLASHQLRTDEAIAWLRGRLDRP